MSSTATSTVTSYTFRVLNTDGTTFGTGCFTFEGDADYPHVQHRRDVLPTNDSKLTAFWYRDPVVGVLDLSALLALDFSDLEGARQFQFNAWARPDYRRGLVTGIATPEKTGPISAHRNDATSATSLDQAKEVLTVPKVDLVVVIDTSSSMRDEGSDLDAAVSAAIEAAKSSCPSDLRVTYLGIAGVFRDTRFNQTVRDYLTTTVNVPASALRGRTASEVERTGDAKEDGARTIEDVSLHFDWRADAARAIFFLGDEALEGGSRSGKQDIEDIEAATRAIGVANQAGVRVHTYLGKSWVQADAQEQLATEYARVAQQTGGRAFTDQDSIRGFTGLLQSVICGSRVVIPEGSDASCCGRQLAWPVLAEPTVEVIQGDELTVPLVDLVVAIDTSVSMRDEAVALDAAMATAISSARAQCPSDLRVVYLGIEGSFSGTRFTETVRDYLTSHCQVDESQLRGRLRGTVQGGGAQEDGARVVEDLSNHFDWRAGAERAVFFLGDESLDGGNLDRQQDEADIEAANVAIAIAKAANVRVHTYLGTSSVKASVKDAIAGEYARLSQETGGKAFTSQDALEGFQALLEKVICGSKPEPRQVLHPFCCCQEYVDAE